MNNQAAQFIVGQLEHLEQERRLLILNILKESGDVDFSMLTNSELDIVNRIVFWEEDLPNFWDMEDDTIDEVIEAVELDSFGHCDNCNRYNALSDFDGSSGETSQCRWGCK